MTLYRKRPAVVDARQFVDEYTGSHIVEWINSFGGSSSYHAHLMDGKQIAHPDPFIKIKTLEGVMIANLGDWVIQGVEGEFYPCKDTIFKSTYKREK